MSNHPKTTPLFRELEHSEETPLSTLRPICEPIEAIQVQAPAGFHRVDSIRCFRFRPQNNTYSLNF